MNIEVRRNTAVAGGVGIAASVVALAYLLRALQDGSARDWILLVVLAAIAVVYLQSLWDARTPLFVADEVGVRMRTGKEWRGLAWTDIEAVEVLRRRGWRDGALDVLPRGPVEDADPISIPLSLATRIGGIEPAPGSDRVAALVEGLNALADGHAEVAEIEGYEYVDEDEWAAAHDEPSLEDAGVHLDELPDATPGGAAAFSRPLPAAPVSEDLPGAPEPTRVFRPLLDRVTNALAERRPRRPLAEPAVEPATGPAPAPFVGVAAPVSVGGAPVVAMLSASPTPSPLRAPIVAVRAEVASDLARLDLVEGATALAPQAREDDDERRPALPEARELRRPGSIDLVEDTLLWSQTASAASAAFVDAEDADAGDVVPEAEPAPVRTPIIGPQLAAARARLELSVDQLAERTRIRPHVIESIEIDDFGPCGGDFYARGHLRTLARVLGLDAAPLVAAYDDRYADAPIDPRRVFEAELAGAAIRGTRGGPNWSVLIAGVMVVVLGWSIMRLVTDAPTPVREPLGAFAPAGSTAGGTGGSVPVVLTAAGGGARVWVRDAENKLVFRGTLAFGETKVLRGVAQPVRVQSSDGSLEVTVDGTDHGALGRTGRPAQATFVASD
ncbi:helix-turn-helix domain-containing protein [Nocardioides fonticola]|uniref:helix-turn-helix domain-containing protein n=1 Tax=Nocardioides fonticola TaxID=450363 RepID=UPI0031D90AD9